MSDLDLLRNYKAQNPKKYVQKFGDVPPEEAVLKSGNPFFTSTVKVDIGEKTEIEQKFVEPVQPVVPTESVAELLVEPQLEANEDVKPKRGRKPKA
jgi:hypothetical protein